MLSALPRDGGGKPPSLLMRLGELQTKLLAQGVTTALCETNRATRGKTPEPFEFEEARGDSRAELPRDMVAPLAPVDVMRHDEVAPRLEVDAEITQPARSGLRHEVALGGVA